MGTRNKETQKGEALTVARYKVDPQKGMLRLPFCHAGAREDGLKARAHIRHQGPTQLGPAGGREGAQL